ncbi:hypothetical protein E2C01_068957 [Portunus trituberculatus]|uniref:Uncharacterized protein n=1 Tax=Portunus trituberculatus TaxID=210409 RepID=A0A5B7HNT8_PORTR|nr:hypothetical protein [Portunus trituberculatus]
MYGGRHFHAVLAWQQRACPSVATLPAHDADIPGLPRVHAFTPRRRLPAETDGNHFLTQPHSSVLHGLAGESHLHRNLPRWSVRSSQKQCAQFEAQDLP